MRHLAASRAAVMVASSIVLAACGGSPTASPGSDTAGQGDNSAAASKAAQTYARINALSGKARTDELEEVSPSRRASFRSTRPTLTWTTSSRVSRTPSTSR